MAACGIKNGNKESPGELMGDFLKIVVIGEPRCGKTTFIRECVRNNSPGAETSMNGVRVYPCAFQFNGSPRNILFFEIPSDPDFFPEQRTPHYKADIFVYMYAIDDPSSLEELKTKWIPETSLAGPIMYSCVALVGNKEDLRNNQQVIARLAHQNQVPVTAEQTTGFFGPEAQRSVILQLSSNDSDAVLDAFTQICRLTLLNYNL